MKIISVFGTRPEAIKMAPILQELEHRLQGTDSKSVTCITGQHRQMLDQVLRTFNLRADIDLDLMRKNQTLAALSARGITRLTSVLEKERPDLVLVQGDTTTAMIGALSAFYCKIPVGHVEAGLRTGNLYSPFPEEVNRRIITTLATFHFAPTKQAVENLSREGVEQRVYLTGNTVVDALMWVIQQTPSLETLSLLTQLELLHRFPHPAPDDNKRAILVTAHRRENFGRPFEAICQALLKIAARNPDVRIIYPVHLNPNVRRPVQRILGHHERISLIEPLSYECFAHLMNRVDIVITDSGGVQEEAPALGKPVLVLRNETERPEAVGAGCVKVVGTEQERIVHEAETLLRDSAAYRRMAHATSPYGDGHAAERIVSVIGSASGITSEHSLSTKGSVSQLPYCLHDASGDASEVTQNPL